MKFAPVGGANARTDRRGHHRGRSRRTCGRRVSETSSISAPYVVVASGFNAEPVIPSIHGMEKFRGKLIHSAAYANAKPFAGQSVLVIGMGNTGAEIALDLSEGARGRASRYATAFTSSRATFSASRFSSSRCSLPECFRQRPAKRCSRAFSIWLSAIFRSMASGARGMAFCGRSPTCHLWR
jgi:lysine/ornithine N-monooxygenase